MKRMLGYFKEPSNIYFLLITLIGSFLFLSYFYPFDFVFSTSEWVLIYAMIAGVILMDHYMFQIPPEGNRQSMDSTVFLAALFIYGARMAFIVLLLSAIIIAFYKKQVPWWKHMINFAVYTIMIASAQTVYSSMGGMENGFSLSLLPAYSLSLTVYFMVNVLLIAGYYFLLYKGKLVVEISRLFLQECIFAYLITLLLAIVLQILIVNTHFFGLFLFLIIAVLLSHVFKQLFFMYHEINDKANKDQRTGLYNHSYLEEKLDDFIKTYRENGKIFSFAMLDLDDFKKYNDLYGHPQGDKLLSFVGSIIKAECEPQEFVCARYGERNSRSSCRAAAKTKPANSSTSSARR